MAQHAFSSVVGCVFSFASQTELRGRGAPAPPSTPQFQKEHHHPTANGRIAMSSASEERVVCFLPGSGGLLAHPAQQQ